MYFIWVPFAGSLPPGSHSPSPVMLRASTDEETLRRSLGDLSTPALVEAWSCTDDELATQPAAARRSALVTLRRLVLDEVERRSPRRYRRWLRRGGPHARRSGRPSVMVG